MIGFEIESEIDGQGSNVLNGCSFLFWLCAVEIVMTEGMVVRSRLTMTQVMDRLRQSDDKKVLI